MQPLSSRQHECPPGGCRRGSSGCILQHLTRTKPHPPSLPHSARRQLYEALLAVEREGGVVIERRLSLVDAVLSPSAALVICDNSAAKLVGS